jgi:hypothetical protein
LALVRKKKMEKRGIFSFLFFSFPPTPIHGAFWWWAGLGIEGLRSQKGFYFLNFNCNIFRKITKKKKKKMKHSNCRCPLSGSSFFL